MNNERSFRDRSCEALCWLIGPFGGPLNRRAYALTVLGLVTVRKAVFLAAVNWEKALEWLCPGFSAAAEPDSGAALLLLLLSGFFSLMALGSYIVPYCVAYFRRLRYLRQGTVVAFAVACGVTWLALSPDMADGVTFKPLFYALEVGGLLLLLPWPDSQ